MRYLQLAHNERNAAGTPVAKVISSLGREDQVDRAALTRLVASISRFLGEPAPGSGPGLPPAGFAFERAPESGGPHVLSALWSELGLGRCLARAAKATRHRSDVERAIFAMVAQRCLAPASKLAATQWLGRDAEIPGLLEVSDDQLYRAMDFLLANGERVQESVFHSVANLLNLEVDVIFFDTTSTYFQADPDEDDDKDAGPGPAQAGIRRLGHSKDHRPDLPQVVIGLAVTRDGIPVRVWIWPGNTNDQTVVDEVKRDLNSWQLGRAVYVMDTGFNSKENLRTLRSTGGHYIAGCKLRSGMAETKIALSRQGRYQQIKDNLRVKDIRVGQGDSATRYVVCHNPAEADLQRDRRDGHLARITTELERLAAQRERANTNSETQAHHRGECALRDHRTLGRYLRQTKTGRLVLDRAKITAEERLDGKYLLTTSDMTLAAEDVALGYRKLLEAERSFRDLKGTLLLRPVYHRREDRIRAHVLVCFLALILVRVAEQRTSQTWRQLRPQLGEIRNGHFTGPDGSFTQTTELTALQRGLLRELGVPEPPRITQVTPQNA